jgi:hypothetical protein
VVSVCTRTLPERKSTRATCPSGSRAVAVNVIVAGATKLVPLIVSATRGGLLAAACPVAAATGNGVAMLTIAWVVVFASVEVVALAGLGVVVLAGAEVVALAGLGVVVLAGAEGVVLAGFGLVVLTAAGVVVLAGAGVEVLADAGVVVLAAAAGAGMPARGADAAPLLDAFATAGVPGRGCACRMTALEVVLPPSASCATADSV